MTTPPARQLTALSLVLAPTLLGAALLTDITPQADGTRELLTLIAEKPGAWSTGQTLFFLSAVAWLPAGLALMRLFGREARVGRLAGAAVAVGGLAMLPIDAAGLYLRKLAASDIPLDQQVSLVDGVESSPTLLVLETVHVAGLFLGLLVVGGAMLQHRDLPRWAGVLVLVGMVGMVAAPGRPLLAVAAALLAVGLGVAAVRVGRLAEDELNGGPEGRDTAPSKSGRRAHQRGSYQQPDR